MRTCPGCHDQGGRAHALHHTRHQRMNGRDIGGHSWHIRQGGAREKGCGDRKGNEVSGHIRLHVIV